MIFTPLFVEKEDKAFDPETQFFYEEYILALQLQAKAYKIVYDPAMTVKHESGAATKKSYHKQKKRSVLCWRKLPPPVRFIWAGLRNDV